VVRPDLELGGHHLEHLALGQGERLAQVRVADEGDRGQLVPDLQAAGRLLGGEDVLELLEVERRAVAEAEVLLAHLVGQLAQPAHVRLAELVGMHVERVAGGVVVVGVVHAPGHRCVVVAEDGERGHAADRVAALVG
jgi:hypothetical protein